MSVCRCIRRYIPSQKSLEKYFLKIDIFEILSKH